MTRYSLTLPAIDYGSDVGIQFPTVTNSLVDLPPKFSRWGTHMLKADPVHCFVDDWRLEAIWRDKYKMIDKVLISQYACTPDYTIETDTPLVYALYQVWRSRTIGRYWQDHGVYCIPSLQWSRPEINLFLFSGLEDAEVVAVRSPTAGFLDEWRICVEQFLSVCQPKLVLHFGTKRGFDIWPSAINLNLR